ncbi:MAG: Zn-ribbon domain-containing OB-fold protein [Desulfurococcales archaeon]|nr:Zn-ribbon domain-containing OB-fold protein [Desulfurococcales archaeon]
MSMEYSVPIYWRNRLHYYRLIGGRCKKCDRVFFPPQNRCPYCGSDEIEPVNLPRIGKLLSYTVSYNPPEGYKLQTPLIIGLIDLGETRIIAQLTDISPEEISEGIEVEAVVRKIREDRTAGLIHYGYKFRPVIGQE